MLADLYRLKYEKDFCQCVLVGLRRESPHHLWVVKATPIHLRLRRSLRPKENMFRFSCSRLYRNFPKGVFQTS